MGFNIADRLESRQLHTRRDLLRFVAGTGISLAATACGAPSSPEQPAVAATPAVASTPAIERICIFLGMKLPVKVNGEVVIVENKGLHYNQPAGDPNSKDQHLLVTNGTQTTEYLSTQFPGLENNVDIFTLTDEVCFKQQ